MSWEAIKPGTQLPWQWDEARFRLFHSVPASHSSTVLCAHDEVFRPSPDDAAYIVHAANTLPTLAAHAERLAEALDECRVVLKSIPTLNNHTPWCRIIEATSKTSQALTDYRSNQI